MEHTGKRPLSNPQMPPGAFTNFSGQAGHPAMCPAWSSRQEPGCCQAQHPGMGTKPRSGPQPDPSRQKDLPRAGKWTAAPRIDRLHHVSNGNTILNCPMWTAGLAPCTEPGLPISRQNPKSNFHPVPGLKALSPAAPHSPDRISPGRQLGNSKGQCQASRAHSLRFLHKV